jgi:hypothetical protein
MAFVNRAKEDSMWSTLNPKNTLASLLMAIAALIACAGQAAGEAPSIEGTYKLVSRELPNGTKQGPPDVLGLITYTKEYRNFNVYVKDANGKSFSISSISTYKLTDTEYSEKNIYNMVNDEDGGLRVTYDVSGSTATSPVSVKDRRIEFQLPLHGEPYVVFESDKLTATRKGAFIDYWERVK